MATEELKRIKKAVLKLVDEPKPKGGFNKARNELDKALTSFEARDKQIDRMPDEDEKKKAHTKFSKEKSDFLRELDSELKAKGYSLIQVLKGDIARSHDLVYDAFGETMEPIYYWVLDFMRENLSYNIGRYADYFGASEASGYFGEMGGRRTALEKQASELMRTINAVVKSIINLLWDLKTFDIRLKNYDDLKSKDPNLRLAGMEGLKGVWMTEVDAAKGPGSLNQLAQNLNFITIRDAFMAIPVQNFYDPEKKNIDDARSKAAKYVQGIDTTDVVKRILAPRIQEFIAWLGLSERELRQRRKIEKAYLKSQVESLKVYTRWARPYLIATEKLIPAEFKNLLARHKELGIGPHEIPTPFHAMWMYLELTGHKKTSIEVTRGAYGAAGEMKLDNENNRPYATLEVRFGFRGSPVTAAGPKGERGQIYTGKTFMSFQSFIVQERHKKLIDSWRDDEVLDFIEGMTKESLDTLKEDLMHYLEEKEEELKVKAKFELPFSKWVKDTFGSVQKFNKEAKALLESMPKLKMSSSDAWKVARLRLIAKEKAEKDCDKVFFVYKVAHRMPAPPM